MTPTRILLAALLASAAACAPPPVAGPAPLAAPPRTAIAAALDSIFDTPAFASAHWGVLVRSAETGETLYARNPGKMFVPASNVKLVTASAALQGLGPEYRYRTAIVAAGPVRGGALEGDLVVVGSGDPTVSARFAGDPRAVLRAWADSLRARGVTRISGRVLGDDDVFDERALGRGWAWDDVDAAYSAEISGLPFDEGSAALRVEPGAEAGSAARVSLAPATAYLRLAADVATGAPESERRVRVERGADPREIRVSGSIPAGGEALEQRVSVPDNTAYFAAVLRETLAEAGIAVGGDAAEAQAGWGAGRTVDTLFVHRSPPLREILPGFMKPSQNQIGEILLKTLGAELRGMGTAGAGIVVVDSLFRMRGLPTGLLSQADGSGLSRYNLAAPELLVLLLEGERGGPHFAVYADALPVAGVDGTLAGRMGDTPLQANVRAKTGTLSGVRALSGYLATAEGEPLVFSMLVNHHTLTARDADRLAEAALMRLYALPRGR